MRYAEHVARMPHVPNQKGVLCCIWQLWSIASRSVRIHGLYNTETAAAQMCLDAAKKSSRTGSLYDATGNKRWWHGGQLIDSHLISDPVDSALSLHLFRFFYLQFQAKWHAVGGTDPRLVPTVNVLRITKPAPIVSQVMLGRAVTQPHRESPISRPRRTGPPNCYPLLWQWGAVLFISNSHQFQLSKDISL